MSELPQNTEIEAQIIGRMIRFGERAHEIISAMREEQFFSARHQLIFAAVAKMAENGSPSFPSVAASMERAGTLAHVGGAAYLMDISDSVVSMVGVESDIGIVQDAYKRRQAIELARQILNDAQEAETADEVISGAISRIAGIVNGSGSTKTGFSHAASNLDSVLSTEKPREIPTGLDWFDELYTPRPGNFIVLAGFSGGGKTALAAGVCASMARTGNVLLASLEMSKDEILERSIPWTTDIPIQRIRKRELNDEEAARARQEIVGRGLYFTDAESIYDIEQSARSLKVSRGLDAVMIDYLQLLEGGKRGEQNRAQEVAAISRHCKMMARRLDCVVYALSQLNNDASRDGIPKIHHLKESGGIRQDADAVFMIYPPNPDDYRSAKNALNELQGRADTVEAANVLAKARITVAKRVLELQKGRSAPETSVGLMFEGQYTRFRRAKPQEWTK